MRPDSHAGDWLVSSASNRRDSQTDASALPCYRDSPPSKEVAHRQYPRHSFSMEKPRRFIFEYRVAPKLNRWVSDLTVFAEVTNPALTADAVQQRVTEYLETGDNPPMLRELRGDLSFDWRSESGVGELASKPIFDHDGLKVFGPIRGVRMAGL